MFSSNNFFTTVKCYHTKWIILPWLELPANWQSAIQYTTKRLLRNKPSNSIPTCLHCFQFCASRCWISRDNGIGRHQNLNHRWDELKLAAVTKKDSQIFSKKSNPKTANFSCFFFIAKQFITDFSANQFMQIKTKLKFSQFGWRCIAILTLSGKSGKERGNSSQSGSSTML